jgi:hypothetical protein
LKRNHQDVNLKVILWRLNFFGWEPKAYLSKIGCTLVYEPNVNWAWEKKWFGSSEFFLVHNEFGKK